MLEPQACIVEDITYVRCEDGCVEYGRDDGIRTRCRLEAGASVLAARGSIFTRVSSTHSATNVEPKAWTLVAAELSQLPPNAESYCSYLAGHSGAFWVAHIGGGANGTPSWMLAGIDVVGQLPLWIGACGGCCCASPHWKPSFLDWPRTPALACPRVVYQWIPFQGVLSSRPRDLFGLHWNRVEGRGISREIPDGVPALARDTPTEHPESVQLLTDGAEAAALGDTMGRSITDPEEGAAVLEGLVVRALHRCVPQGTQRVGILFSGGLDSGLLARLCARGDAGACCSCVCYTAGFHTAGKVYPEDLSAAAAAASSMSLEWLPEVVDPDGADALLRDCAPIVVDLNVPKASVAMTMLAACRLAARDGTRLVLSGLGSEEVFAGYHRHEPACAAGQAATRRDRTLGLAQMYHRDLQRDFAVAALAGVQIRYPYLDYDVMAFALELPAAVSPSRDVIDISLAADGAKSALRAVARRVGTPQAVYARRKKAAQYGSRFHHALRLISSRWAHAGVLRQGPAQFRMANLVMSAPGASYGPLALLFTSGKESVQAFCVHRSVHASFACVLPPTMPRSPRAGHDDHAAAEAFAARAGLPLFTGSAHAGVGLRSSATSGNAGYDVTSLEFILGTARDTLGVEGVACGHVCELGLWGDVVHVCDRVGLRPYAPLWGNFPTEIVVSKMLTDGCRLRVSVCVDPSIVGRQINTQDDLDVVMARLRSTVGEKHVRVDSDAGLLDCDVLSCPFFMGAAAMQANEEKQRVAAQKTSFHEPRRRRWTAEVSRQAGGVTDEGVDAVAFAG